MTKRNLFAELEEGFDALADERAGKVTLRSSTVEYRPALDDWLHDHVAPAYDAIKVDPSRAVSIAGVRERIIAEDDAARKK
ncbi:hypothetical protein [Massilia polaris]|uniref:hypothetical protein n=1 Tax=Massilia polaris TaxID=2728846 RepID=UPI001E643FEA|nr:hypothetical protein [Massilia polaris]